MKIFNYLVRSLLKSAISQPTQLDERTRRDIGLDAMAAEHLKDERLWRELAA